MVLLLSTYDLGRQPFGLASPAAWLIRAGVEVVSIDLSRAQLQDEDVRRASLVAFYLPMHTATRLALPVIDRVRRQNPSVHLAAYGLYAPLSEAVLREHGISTILGPEFEANLVRLATGERLVTSAALPRLPFIIPERRSLPALSSYATLQMPDGTQRVAGATDASRGCKHRCRHCPIVPVYNGHFRVVGIDVVLGDIEQQIAAGAGHITFGDPDFFNGPAHARRIVEMLHERHPAVTYDVTIKIEHLLQHRALLDVLARTGCLFVTSAVEAVDDEILQKLEKGHTRDDFIDAVHLCRAAGLTLAPTFVAFTPWTTRDGYRDLLATISGLDLIDHVAPIQWGLRLLITQGSRLLELDDIRAGVQGFNPRTLTYPWTHRDPQVDVLQHAVMQMVGSGPTRSRRAIFEDVAALAEPSRVREETIPSRTSIPYLNEPWYC